MNPFDFRRLVRGEDKDKKISLLLTDLASLEDYINGLLNFSPLPICFVSPLGVILETNPAFEKVSGFPSEEIIGESVEKIFDKQEVAKLAKETFSKGVVAAKELSILRKDGSAIITQVFTRVRVDEQSRPIGYFLGLFNLSGIKKTEEELRKVQAALLNILEDTEEARRGAEEEKDKTQAVITNFSDGLLFFDKNHRLTLINPKAEDFFKISKEKLIGKLVKEIAGFPEVKSLINFLGESIEEVFRKEFAVTKEIIFEVSAIPMKSGASDLGDLVVLHDVSREKMIERLKTEFVSLAAHQLRTPLSAIKWSLRMLLDGDIGEISKEQKDIVEKTYQSNERMITLINDLLNLARIEEGKYVINPVLADMVEICQSTIEFIGSDFRNKGIKLEFLKPAKKPIRVFADEEKLKLVVQNLVDNAFKYTPKGGKVTVSLKETANEVRTEVQDTGIGIADNEQKRVFTKFFRASEAVLTEPAGSGLGLYMAKNIIESHGGKIGFTSKQNKGTTFYFTLPKADSKAKQ
ncbi:MAG: PAS domain-containing sensor histidine kinase [bacterium]|nr:PAS domain-containing sensor histidine kinase [bacterium]